MGFLWDLIQQSQISEHQSAAASLEQRVAALEQQLQATQQLQRQLLERLEKHFGEDIDGDGLVG